MKNYIRMHFADLVILILIFIFSSINLNAQEKQDSSLLLRYKRLPILNNFRFIPSDIVRDPFINTYVKLNAGSGTALDLKNYVKNLDGEIIDTLSGNVTYLSGELEFQLAVNDWLAFALSYGGSGRLGTNAFTIITSGITYQTTMTLFGKARIWENDKMFLSGSIDYSSSDVTLYSIYDFVKKVQELNGDIDSAKSYLLETETLPKAFINLNYAYAPADWFGLLGVAGWGVAKPFENKQRGNLRLGIAASVDFLNVESIHFPLGLLVSARYNSFSENGSNIDNYVTLGFRIGYTGHKDFDIGIENTYSNLNYKKSDEKVKAMLIAFKIRYYF